ncbi:MAG: BMP family lipoprotein [Actinomycetes bacterium]
MRRIVKLASAVLAGALVLSACGGDDGDGGGGGGSEQETLKVGLAYDIGGRGDKSFNDAAARGLDKAKADLGVETKELSASQGETDADKEERLRLLAEQDFNPIIAVGFAYAVALGKVAPDFPDTTFAIVDDASVKGKNVTNLVFAEQEGSFLVGAAAALKSETGTIGFVGGVETPLIKKFEAGYIAGAQNVKPDTKVEVNYLTQPPDFTGFADPAKGQESAAGLFDAGADVVYQAAGGSGPGVFEAAADAGGLAIGVDSDQYKTADPSVQDVILTSMLKKVDVAVFDFVESVQNGSVKPGEVVYDLEANGVDYSTTGGQVDDIEPQLEDLKQQIINGEIKVPTAP